MNRDGYIVDCLGAWQDTVPLAQRSRVLLWGDVPLNMLGERLWLGMGLFQGVAASMHHLMRADVRWHSLEAANSTKIVCCGKWLCAQMVFVLGERACI